MSALFPWPSRSQRQAAIGHARQQKELSRIGAEHAAAIERDIQRIRADNHFAAKIAEQIMRGRDQ
jgi:hypothetical protein